MMARRHRTRTATVLATAILLAACSAASGDPATRLETELANDRTDPLIRDTLNAPLALDSDLAVQANINAVRTGTPMPGNAMPPLARIAGDMPMLPFPGGRRLAAPEPANAPECPDCGPDGPATLGALARAHARRTPSVCRTDPGYRLDYGMQWAEQVPPPFALFPGVALMDAAGLDAPACLLAGISLATTAPMRDLVDYYYTQARRAGYSVVHERGDTLAMLIGTRARGKASFILVAHAGSTGETHADLMVTQSR